MLTFSHYITLHYAYEGWGCITHMFRVIIITFTVSLLLVSGCNDIVIAKINIKLRFYVIWIREHVSGNKVKTVILGWEKGNFFFWNSSTVSNQI